MNAKETDVANALLYRLFNATEGDEASNFACAYSKLCEGANYRATSEQLDKPSSPTDPK